MSEKNRISVESIEDNDEIDLKKSMSDRKKSIFRPQNALNEKFFQLNKIIRDLNSDGKFRFSTKKKLPAAPKKRTNNSIINMTAETVSICEIEKNRVDLVDVYEDETHYSSSSNPSETSQKEMQKSKVPVVELLTAKFDDKVGVHQSKSSNYLSLGQLALQAKIPSSLDSDLSSFNSSREESAQPDNLTINQARSSNLVITTRKTKTNLLSSLGMTWETPWFQERHKSQFDDSYHVFSSTEAFQALRSDILICGVDLFILVQSLTKFSQYITYTMLKTLQSKLQFVQPKDITAITSCMFRSKLQKIIERVILSNSIDCKEFRGYGSYMINSYFKLSVSQHSIRENNSSVNVIKAGTIQVVYHSFIMSRKVDTSSKLFTKQLSKMEQCGFCKILFSQEDINDVDHPMPTKVELYFDIYRGKFRGTMNLLHNFLNSNGEYTKVFNKTIIVIYDGHSIRVEDMKQFLALQNHKSFSCDKLKIYQSIIRKSVSS